MRPLPDLKPTQLTAEQQRLSSEIASTRDGAVLGPFAVWLRTPAIADTANQFDNQLRLHGTIEKRLFELAVLVVARAWTAEYEWYAHQALARKAGLQDDVIESIRVGRSPCFTQDDERIVYETAYEISVKRSLSDSTYQAAEILLGTDKLIELITLIGLYTLVAVVVTSFECPVPDGSRPLAST